MLNYTNLDTLVTGAGGHSAAIEVVAYVMDQVLVVRSDGLGLEHAGRLASLHCQTLQEKF